MQYDPKIHHRKSIRLKNYDYSQAGLYFVTICTQNQLHLFGEIVNDEMVLNDAGVMIDEIWHEIPYYYHKFAIHELVIMPNHIHGIIEIVHNTVGAGPRACPDDTSQTGQPQGVAPTGLGDILHRFKTLTTKRYIDGVKNDDWPRFNGKLWQRNYWEHIVRNENEYNHIAQYIMDNPKKWALDKLNVGAGLCVCPNTIREPSAIYNDEVWMV